LDFMYLAFIHLALISDALQLYVNTPQIRGYTR